MGRLYSVEQRSGHSIFRCNFCSFETDRRGDILRHLNPKDPNRCKVRNWEAPRLVYLAAGISERLRPFVYTTPKALIEFEGVSITEMCLQAFSELGVTEAALLIGYLGDMIKQRIGNTYAGIKIEYIYNPFYSITGGAHSLWLAREFFEGKPSIIMDGDHLIDPRLLSKLMNAPYENCMLVDDTQVLNKPTEETAIVGRDGMIKYLAWSPAGELFQMVGPEDVIGEAVVIVRLGAKASTTLSYEVDRYLQEGRGGKLEHIEPFNNTFKRHDTWYLSTEGLPWIEIDFDYDLERARNEIFPAIKQRRLMKYRAINSYSTEIKARTNILGG